MFKNRRLLFSVPYNLFLITAGSVIFGIGLKAIAVPHGLITGGVSGLGLLLFYLFKALTPGVWYLVLNVPIFIAGWVLVSRRFFFYSLYGTVIVSLAVDLTRFQVPVHDPLMAVMAGGAVIGAGCGIILHSLGSAGGNDIIAVILHQRYNLPMGRFYFLFNLVLFAIGVKFMELDLVLYSLAMSFVSSQVMDHFLSIFNQRKMALVISERSEAIAARVLSQMHRGATFLQGTGAYTKSPKQILLTVVSNIELKRLEEAVFTEDPEAFLITENTFNVIGRGFSQRKQY